MKTIAKMNVSSWQSLYVARVTMVFVAVENVQEHGSVVMHLLSQLSVGMDLTKITLPTFILERRSLLEMFADFFAHPDLFAQ